jgi:hypothetical protein
MNEEGFRLDSVKTPEPLSYTESSGDLYSVIPQDVQLISANGSQIGRHSYLIGISSDNGTTWKFVDGQGIGADRKNIETVLPKFPKDLPLPAVKVSLLRLGEAVTFRQVASEVHALVEHAPDLDWPLPAFPE